MDEGRSGLALSTRAVILVVMALGVVVALGLAWSLWQVVELLADPFLWFLGFIALCGAAWAAAHLVAAVPSLLHFYRSFSAADPSSYYGGFVPAAALLAPSAVVASLGGRALLWLPPALVALVIIGLLLLPATRRDFGQ